jgi:hypothetical protein
MLLASTVRWSATLWNKPTLNRVVPFAAAGCDAVHACQLHHPSGPQAWQPIPGRTDGYQGEATNGSMRLRVQMPPMLCDPMFLLEWPFRT